MSGPKRNPDRLNTIGVVVVGICGAVLVYVSIAALQAFYMNDSSEVQTMADYGGNDTNAKSLRSAQINTITSTGSNPADPKRPATYHIAIDQAMKLTVEAAKADPANTVPTVGRSDKATVEPIYGRPKPLATAPAPAPTDGAGAGSGSAAPAGAGAGSGSAAPTGGAPAGAGAEGAKMVPTGAGAAAGPGPAGKAAEKATTPGAHPATKTSGDNRAPNDKAAGSGAGSAAKGSAAKGNGK